LIPAFPPKQIRGVVILSSQAKDIPEVKVAFRVMLWANGPNTKKLRRPVVLQAETNKDGMLELPTSRLGLSD
jgi:hypothetical protein